MEHAQSTMAGSWGLHPTLDMPELVPPAVLFSIQDEDPRPKYRNALAKLNEAREEGRLGHLPGVPPGTIKQWTLRSAWDSIFHDIPGDRVALLSQTPVPSPASGEERALSHVVLIKSSDPPGKKWLVTRAIDHRGKAMCWCIPVDVERGNRAEVVLNAENITALDTL